MNWWIVGIFILVVVLSSVITVILTKSNSNFDRMEDNKDNIDIEDQRYIDQVEWDRTLKSRQGKLYRARKELVNAFNYIDVYFQRHNIPYMIFFGTLLGIIRDGKPIDNDDDVDVIVDYTYYSQVVNMILEEEIHVNIKRRNSFIQVYSSNGVAIDVYFYQRLDRNELHFDWNFQRCNASTHNGEGLCCCMRINLEDVLPSFPYEANYETTTHKYFIPANPITVVRYLYGARWREKLKKQKDYSTKCVNYIPTTTYFTQEKYWDEYYSSASVPLDASGFARFVHQQYMFECDSKHIDSPRRLLELGCGNARDTCFFQALDNIDCIAMDGSKEAIDKNVRKCPSAHFFCRDFETDEFPNIGKVDYVYTRWTLHSVNEHTENRMLDYIVECMHESSKLFIEVRTTDDAFYGRGEKVEGEEHAYNYGHYRRFIVADDLKSKLESNYGMSIDYFQVSDEFSVVHDDRPTLVRIVASLS